MSSAGAVTGDPSRRVAGHRYTEADWDLSTSPHLLPSFRSGPFTREGAKCQGSGIMVTRFGFAPCTLCQTWQKTHVLYHSRDQLEGASPSAGCTLDGVAMQEATRIRPFFHMPVSAAVLGQPATSTTSAALDACFTHRFSSSTGQAAFHVFIYLFILILFHQRHLPGAHHSRKRQ